MRRRDPFGPHGHPRGRGRRLSTPLRLVTLAAFALAVAALAVPGSAGVAFGRALIVVLVGVPVARVVFLAGRWWQIGDRRFAAAALAVLVVLGAGAAAALIA